MVNGKMANYYALCIVNYELITTFARKLTKGVLAIMPAEIIPMNLMQVMLP